MKNGKKISVLMLFLAVMLLCTAFGASAAERGTEGYYTYSVENGKATIESCDKSIGGNVVIPDTLCGYPVTSIMHQAFYGCNELTGITMGKNVTYLGERAFWRCKSLKYINFGDSVTFIGSGAFMDCESLESIVLPKGVTYIGTSAFACCTSLTSATLPESMTRIPSAMFNECTKLKKVVIPEGITDIASGAFASCIELTEVIIPNSVTEIMDFAFLECNITQITIPKGVKKIGDGALGYVFTGEDKKEIVKLDDFTICGYTGSSAEFYAKNNGFTFIVLDDTSSNCSHICHKGGISKFFYKIALFFWKIFKTNQYCSCGAKHY